jgi:hypothetical protein
MGHDIPLLVSSKHLVSISNHAHVVSSPPLCVTFSLFDASPTLATSALPRMDRKPLLLGSDPGLMARGWRVRAPEDKVARACCGRHVGTHELPVAGHRSWMAQRRGLAVPGPTWPEMVMCWLTETLALQVQAGGTGPGSRETNSTVVEPGFLGFVVAFDQRAAVLYPVGSSVRGRSWGCRGWRGILPHPRTGAVVGTQLASASAARICLQSDRSRIVVFLLGSLRVPSVLVL